MQARRNAARRAQSQPNATVLPGGCTKAREKAAAAGLDVELRAGDAHEPGLPEASVDVVIARHVLWLLHEPERAVSAWARITRPGGLIVGVDGVWGPTAHDEEGLAGSPPPLCDVTDARPAAEVFRRAGLRDVRHEWLAEIDRVERAAMTVEERRTMRWRRYLVKGFAVHAPKEDDHAP